MLCSKYCRVGEGKPKIYFDKKAAYNCDHLPEYMDKFCSEFDSSVLWHQHTKEISVESFIGYVRRRDAEMWWVSLMKVDDDFSLNF